MCQKSRRTVVIDSNEFIVLRKILMAGVDFN